MYDEIPHIRVKQQDLEDHFPRSWSPYVIAWDVWMVKMYGFDLFNVMDNFLWDLFVDGLLSCVWFIFFPTLCCCMPLNRHDIETLNQSCWMLWNYLLNLMFVEYFKCELNDLRHYAFKYKIVEWFNQLNGFCWHFEYNLLQKLK